LDAITLIVILFVGFIVLIVAFLFRAIIIAIFRKHPTTENQRNYRTFEDDDKEKDQISEDIREDSEGDGLMLFDDPLFPTEFDEDDDDL
jgi:flagellar biosynthesis/type III secretory pathway M-ring protein FliF/YscJ